MKRNAFLACALVSALVSQSFGRRVWVPQATAKAWSSIPQVH